MGAAGGPSSHHESTAGPRILRLYDTVGEAWAALAEASEHWWQLALSQARVAEVEATKFAKGDLSREDLEEVAFQGLYDAAIRFDPDRGFRFSTLARWWVRNRLTRYAQQQSAALSGSVGAQQLKRQIHRAIRYRQGRGEPWSPRSIADEVGVSIGRLQEVSALPDRLLPLDVPISEDGQTLAECVPGSDLSMEEQLDERRQAQRLRQALSAMPRNTRLLVVLRFGLGGGDPQSYPALAARFGVGRDRIKKALDEALDTLREAMS